MAEYDVKTLWVEYEKIAMHFNDLLIKLRTQSLGGLAAIGFVTLAGKGLLGEFVEGIRDAIMATFPFTLLKKRRPKIGEE